MEGLTCPRSYNYEVAEPGFKQAEGLSDVYLPIFSKEDNSLKEKKWKFWMMKAQLDCLWPLKVNVFERPFGKFGCIYLKMTNNNNNINDRLYFFSLYYLLGPILSLSNPDL